MWKALIVGVEVDQALLTVELTCLGHGFVRGVRTLYKSRALLILQQGLDQVYVNLGSQLIQGQEDVNDDSGVLRVWRRVREPFTEGFSAIR